MHFFSSFGKFICLLGCLFCLQIFETNLTGIYYFNGLEIVLIAFYFFGLLFRFSYLS